MPCDTITRVKLELKNANLSWLRDALKECGYSWISDTSTGIQWQGGNYNQNTGELTVRSEREGNKIKKAYSGQMVQKITSRFNWRVKQLETNKYHIQRG